MSLDELCHANLHLDVWECTADFLTVAASEAALDAIQRDDLANVRRIETVASFVRRQRTKGVL
jgi:hypothetical protein